MDISGFSLGDSVTAGNAIAEAAAGNEEDPSICPGCGFTSSKFQQTGRLGCSQCYLTFSDAILARLGSMHRGLRHFGKHPEGFEGDAFSERLLAECQERLQLAVEAENYEEAARIRDEIRHLEAGPDAPEQEKASASEVGGDSGP